MEESSIIQSTEKQKSQYNQKWQANFYHDKFGTNPDWGNLFNAYRLFCGDQKMNPNCDVLSTNFCSKIGSKLAETIEVEEKPLKFSRRKNLCIQSYSFLEKSQSYWVIKTASFHRAW